jgi:hypothetical protein
MVALVAAATFAVSGQTSAATPGSVTWVNRFDGGYDGATALATSPDGSAVFVGGFTGYSENGEYLLSAIDSSSGATLWSHARSIGAEDMIVSANGSRIFVTGSVLSSHPVTQDYIFPLATAAFSTVTGGLVWYAAYEGPSLSGSGRAIALSPDGSTLFVTGQSGGAAPAYASDFITLAYSTDSGALRWLSRYDDPQHRSDDAWAMAVSPDGSTVYVTGRSYGAASGSQDYFTIAYSATSGARRWVRRYDGPAHHDDWAMSLAVSPDGSAIFVTGRSEGRYYRAGDPSGYLGDYATISYFSSGQLRWIKRFDGPPHGEDRATAVLAGPGGASIFVSGWGEGPSTSADFVTMSLTASNGSTRWVRRYDGPLHGEDKVGIGALAMSIDGTKLFVTGGSGATCCSPNADEAVDYATVSYAPSTGFRRWVRRYDGPGHGFDGPVAVATAIDGSRVFVTGTSYGDAQLEEAPQDVTTVAYAT